MFPVVNFRGLEGGRLKKCYYYEYLAGSVCPNTDSQYQADVSTSS